MSNGRGRHAKKIDIVHWTGGFFASLGQAAASSVANTLIAAQHLPETLLRIRGEWACTLDGAVGPGVAMQVVAGIILVPEGTGTTVLWSPATDVDAPWIWWDVANLLYNETVADVIGSQETLSRARVIDSKAMRKIRNTELQVVVETLTVQTATPIDASLVVRVLSGSCGVR